MAREKNMRTDTYYSFKKSAAREKLKKIAYAKFKIKEKIKIRAKSQAYSNPKARRAKCTINKSKQAKYFLLLHHPCILLCSGRFFLILLFFLEATWDNLGCCFEATK